MQATNSFRLLFDKRDRGRLVLLAILTIMNGFSEFASIGILVPYVAVIQDPETIRRSHLFALLPNALRFAPENTLLLGLSGVVFVVFLIKSGFSLFVTFAQNRFVTGKQARLAAQLLDRMSSQPYSYFLARNSSELLSTLVHAVTNFCHGVVQSSLTLVSEGVVIAGLASVLVVVNLRVLLAAVGLMGLLWLVSRVVVRPRVARYGAAHALHWAGMLRVANEAIGAAKDIKVLGCRPYFVERYRFEFVSAGSAITRNATLSQVPRVSMEVVAIGALTGFAAVTMLMGSSKERIVPVLAAFAVAAVRLLPSAARVLSAWNTIAFNRSHIRDLVEALTEGPIEDVDIEGRLERRPVEREVRIAIRHFAYPSNPQFQIVGLDVSIPRGSIVAFIGHSGSGKSTVVDLLLGLHPSYDGSITADGLEIREDLFGWRRRIGYIPQTIYVRDDTFVRNIAFGVPDEEIDLAQVRRVAEAAGLSSVIDSQPRGLETMLGDRGVRLSGGERQRVGIARALYHEPEILVMDEATSALDNQTEARIVDSIAKLAGAKTIVVIAHRLTTVRACDVVYLMEAGRVTDQGKFSEIEARHPDFVNPALALARSN